MVIFRWVHELSRRCGFLCFSFHFSHFFSYLAPFFTIFILFCILASVLSGQFLIISFSSAKTIHGGTVGCDSWRFLEIGVTAGDIWLFGQLLRSCTNLCQPRCLLTTRQSPHFAHING
ncbi:uncharacterized protein YALI1_C19166g [Yarrowia lipolytica]|uniref:Uncharacterized protein n=1 Tax=Yarrowia lipolytica TaxID=4952 RepID=A0A1D8NB28_YARLL|nr:hypothetical protein YALI1_C19166g [Yarrowia lipolytica]